MLMEAINSLGLKVIDANITTSNGMVLNVLKVEVRFKKFTILPSFLSFRGNRLGY